MHCVDREEQRRRQVQRTAAERPEIGTRCLGKEQWLPLPSLTGARILPPRGSRQRCQEFAGVDRPIPPAQLEMQLRLADVAGRADAGDDLAASNLVAALDQYQVAVSVGGDPTVRMFNKDEVAVSSQLVSGVGDDPDVCRLDGGTSRRGNVDAVIMRAVTSRAVTREYMTTYRPLKGAAVLYRRRRRGSRRGRLCGRSAIGCRRRATRFWFRPCRLRRWRRDRCRSWRRSSGGRPLRRSGGQTIEDGGLDPRGRSCDWRWAQQRGAASPPKRGADDRGRWPRPEGAQLRLALAQAAPPTAPTAVWGLADPP